VDAGAPGPDAQYGAGIVNARNALTESLAPARRLFVRLLRAATGEILQTRQAAADGSFTFTTLDDGPYLVYAGEDADGDGVVGAPGRRWGAFGGAAKPQAIGVDGAGTYAASFTTGLPGELEPNDGIEPAMTLPVGGWLQGDITGLDLDVYRVPIAAAGQYTFETSGVRGACGFALEEDTLLRLYDATGVEITFNDDISLAVNNYCSRITMTLAAGTYYVSVQGFYGLRYRVTARQGP
jgi:hypothetical protein